MHAQRSLSAAAIAAAAALALLVSAAPAAAEVRGAKRTNAVLKGIPQHGSSLGHRSARLTLIEFVDPQCPFCRDYRMEVFPTLIRRYVRTGRLRMRYAGLAFMGRDSIRGARAAIAAGTENRLWNFTQVFYVNQGVENSGYVTERFLRQIADATGVSRKTVRDRNGAHERARLRWAQRTARRLRVNYAPAIFLRRRGHRPRELRYEDFEPREFTRRIDAALRRR